MSESETESYSYSDVKKVAARFAADLAMLAQSTGLMSESEVERYVKDIKAMARAGYLSEVNLFLDDANGVPLRGRRYRVSTDASLWSSERPGANAWPRTPGGELDVIVSYSTEWKALSPTQKANFKAKLEISWGPSVRDTRHPGLFARGSRRYASNSFGMEREDYE